MKLSLLIITSVLIGTSALAGGISSGTPNPKGPMFPYVFKNVKTTEGTGYCMITGEKIWLANADGSDNQDNGVKLRLGKTLTEKINQSSEEPIYRGRVQPGLQIFAFDGVKKILLIDGDNGSRRGGPATSWLLNTVEGHCASLR